MVYKPIYIWGAPSCVVIKRGNVKSEKSLMTCRFGKGKSSMNFGYSVATFEKSFMKMRIHVDIWIKI